MFLFVGAVDRAICMMVVMMGEKRSLRGLR